VGFTGKKEQFEQEFFSSPSYWWENRVERVMNMKPVAISLVDRRKIADRIRQTLLLNLLIAGKQNALLIEKNLIIFKL
jgi:hypothetical protein